MKTSESLSELAAALSEAQAEMKAAPMTGRNPHLKNRYATLNDIIDTARAPLARHGLAYVQMPTSPADLTYPAVGLRTRLMHKSGEWLEDEMYFPVDVGSNRAINPAQAAGSVITYMRRYALAAMLGIVADEDADGEQPQAKPQAPPADALLYEDGSFVAAHPKTHEVYHAYVAAHNGKPPANRHNLKAWHDKQQGAPANGTADQPELVEDTEAAQAARDTAAGLFD